MNDGYQKSNSAVLQFLQMKAFRCEVYLKSNILWKCVKLPKNLSSWEHSISVGLPKFVKSFHCTLPKYEAKLDSTPLLKIDITYFWNTLGKNRFGQPNAFKLVLIAYHIFTYHSSKPRLLDVARSSATLAFSLINWHISYYTVCLPCLIRQLYKTE